MYFTKSRILMRAGVQRAKPTLPGAGEVFEVEQNGPGTQAPLYHQIEAPEVTGDMIIIERLGAGIEAFEANLPLFVFPGNMYRDARDGLVGFIVDDVQDDRLLRQERLAA